MPSNANEQYLHSLLADAEELIAAHTQLRTGQRGRQWRLGALNRAVVILAVSAWEAYVEELLKEVLQLARPPSGPLGAWPAWNAQVRSLIGRFNNPNPQNVRELFRDAIGLQNVTRSWFWRNSDANRSRERLSEALRLRHEIAHGVNPRPIIHNVYSSRLPGFFRKLGERTDFAVDDYLMNTLGIRDPW